jgi:hypothetical protein
MYAIVVVIVFSSVQLALENPLANPDSKLAKGLFYTDILTTSVFLVEAVLKVISMGFIANGPESYLSSTWNKVDFLIVFCSILSLSLQVDMQIVKLMRLFRILRPLRIISRNDGLRISI